MQIPCHLLPTDPEDPVESTRATAGSVLRELPRARGLQVAALAHAACPGLTPTPWTLAGLRSAIDTLGVPLAGTLGLGDEEAATRALDAFEPEREEGGRISFALPDGSRLRPPKPWIGRALCLVMPLAHHRDLRRGGWVGPVRRALAELALAAGASTRADPGELARVGARLARELFAGTVFVVDATWWTATCAREGGPARFASSLVAPEHCVASYARPGEDPGKIALGLDRWFADQLGLRIPGGEPERRVSDAERARVRLVGRRRAWPWAKLPALDPRRGLAGRAVEALWREPGRGRAALAPTTPGRFAAAWNGPA